MAYFPATLPPPRLDFERTAASGMVLTPNDAGGPPKARRVNTATVTRLRVSFILNGTQAQALEAFYETTTGMGATAFDGFPDPLDGTQTRQARFLSRPVFGGVAGSNVPEERLFEATFRVALIP